MAAPNLLELRGLTKSYGGVRALRGVDFDLKAGEVHALLGENGAGKSTLIKIVTGAVANDGGTIAIGGQAAGPLTPASSRKLGVACIYQQPALFPDLTVAENIGLRLEPAAGFRRVRWQGRHDHAAQLLSRIGARIDPETEVGRLSMPEQQLVEIACAVGAGARIVIMDEPTASLTQTEQHLLFAVVRDLRANGVGVIYISHRLEEIFGLADRVTVLRDGQSVGSHPVAEIDEAGLIKLMVGREMTQIYPPSESAPGEVVLSIQQVGCSGTRVSDVTFDVRAGEVVGLAGLVGAGRTDLARVLFGLLPCERGEIRLQGKAVRFRSPQDAIAAGIGFVPEDRRRHGVVLDMPIAENMTMAIHRRIFPGTWLRFGAERRLAQGYIGDLAVKTSGPEAPGGSLSGGNQQKVSLARWLATQPKVLILDEPTQGVDVGAKSEIHKIVRRLAKEGLAVILISSDLPEVLGMSDRIGVMCAGVLTAILPGKSDAQAVMAAALGPAKGAA
ncbi:MAG TPA: sugar ABC transporter ATP-binding protein [Opitutaceae bacterium]|jgi:rhamnose transport system ATP-binding protein|nr:sugar ABC transporter ATP-binding protein [Opitutaceae bacterium]